MTGRHSDGGEPRAWQYRCNVNIFFRTCPFQRVISENHSNRGSLKKEARRLSEWLPPINQQQARVRTWRKGTPCTAGGMPTGAATAGGRMECPQKLRMELALDPAILGIYPKRPETIIPKNICAPMFIAMLFTISKIWKCPSADEWIEELWYSHTWNTTRP